MSTSEQIRFEREENIRNHSEKYGQRFCIDNARFFAQALADWRVNKTPKVPVPRVRIYNRSDNEMKEVSLIDVFNEIHLDESGFPLRLYPTAFGQVAISKKLHISVLIYHLITAAWAL